MKRPFRTLHITNAWHTRSGGVGTFYRAMLDAANQQGRAMSLVVPAERTATSRVGELGVIYSFRSPRSPWDDNYRFLLPHRYIGPYSAISKIIEAEAPDVVEICDKYSLPYLGGLLRAGRMPGLRARPAVIGLTCERLDENVSAYVTTSSLGERLARLYMKSVYFALFDHHIAVTGHTAEELRPASRGHKVCRGVWIAPMGVDTRTFTPALQCPEARQELAATCGAGPSAALLFYAGRLAPEKNLSLLVDTLRLLRQRAPREFHLVLAGDGPLRQELASASGAPIHLLGHVGSRERLARLYANCDAFLHPNPREPFGIAPLEAMASGAPLVCPDRGGVRTYATPLNSWPTPVTPEAYAQAALAATAVSADRDRRVAMARATAERYDWSLVCRNYFRLYEQISQATAGLDPEIRPAFYSTPGNLFGFETCPRHSGGVL